MAKEKVKQEQRRRDRTFVAPLTGQYDEIYKRIYSQPRVFHSKEITTK